MFTTQIRLCFRDLTLYFLYFNDCDAKQFLDRSDAIVDRGIYPNRSRFIEDAIASKLKELDEKFIGEQAALLDLQDT
jgi:hypothetical protein